MNRRSPREMRDWILSAAQRIFVREGFGRSGMRLIAREAGISVGALYLHFPGKEDLYLTLFRRRMEELERETVAALQAAGDPRGELEAFVRVSLDFASRSRDMILVQGRELGFSFGVEGKKEYFRRRRMLIEEILRRGVDAGAFRSVDPVEVSKIIFSILRGYIVSMAIDEEALFNTEECMAFVLNAVTEQAVSPQNERERR